MERQAPKQLDYSDVLPIAINSKSQRREFYPEGGAEYGPAGSAKPNIVRIPISAASMLDAQGSYLKYDIKNTGGIPNDVTIGLDFPQSIFKRLRILSGSGAVLEDIQNYNRLYAGVLYPIQAGVGFLHENSITSGQTLNTTHNTVADFTAGTSQTHSIHLCSGLLNSEKYLPLALCNSGLILELEIDNPGSIGVSSAANPTWEISNFRYVAHLIDLDRGFYERLRMVMEGSGGVLAIAGTTFKHFSGAWPAAEVNNTINIPARLKSIKSIFFKNTIEADVTGHQKFGVSDGVTHGLKSYQFRVGSVAYPPNAVQVSATNKGEAYQEIRKSMGTLGDYSHGGVLMSSGSLYSDATTGSATEETARIGPYALDLESFPRTSLESGISTSERALGITLDLTASSEDISTTVDVWCMCDAIFYVNLDGSMSVSV